MGCNSEENTSIIKKMHHLLFLVGLFSLAVVAQVTKKKEDSPSCYRLEDRKWREGADGLFYNYFRLEVTFAEARATCRAQGGDMVMEKTQATHDAIEKLYSHYKGDLTFWVGILASRNASTWLDGSDIKKTWWSTKIPNAKQNNNGKKNCVYHGKADTWYRSPCNEKGFILCQKKVTYECDRCAAEATMLQQAKKNIHIPICAKDNSFMAKQCSIKECWCLQKDGTEISGSRKPKKDKLDCVALRNSPAAQTECQKQAKAGKNGFKPACDADGAFSAQQCVSVISNSDFCWCSLSDATFIPMSLHNKNDRNAPNCPAHRDLIFDCKKKMGTFPHPFDKKRFIYCFINGAYACHCPSGTTFPNKPQSNCG